MVWSLFFGLVAASAIAFMYKVKNWNTLKVCLLIISGLLTWLLLDISPTSTPDHPWFLFLAGLVAICGMLLPGISGAFILLILGKYQFLVDAVHERRFGDLIPIVLGIIVGVLCFSRVLKYLLKHYQEETLSVMIGLLIGSLKILWPGEHLTGNPNSSGWMIVMIGVGVVLVLGLEKVAGVKEVAEV
jgi:putative membrane protein